MLLHIGWLTTLLLGALGLVMGGAHLLELPVRMEYGPHLYMQVTSTLYRFFGLVGGPIQVLALLLSIGLVWRIRGRAAFASTLVGTLGFALSLLLWFLLVQPVNAAWADALRAGPDAAVQAYAQLRTRWELGHVAAFTAWLLGFIMLLHGVLREVLGLRRPASGSPSRALGVDARDRALGAHAMLRGFRREARREGWPVELPGRRGVADARPMVMSPGLVAFFVVAAVLRLGSLFVSIRNEARLRAEGAEEFGAGNSRLMASLHALFYVGAFTESWWRESQIGPWAWLGFALYGGAMLVLLHVVRELGRLWTVKVLVAKRHTLNQSWLFRAVRHPNYYLNIVPELVGLALAMGAWSTLIFLLPCYLLALFRRIRIEEEVMRERFPAYR